MSEESPAPTRTPNGMADLLSAEAGAMLSSDGDAPANPGAAPFAIDEVEEDENEVPRADAADDKSVQTTGSAKTAKASGGQGQKKLSRLSVKTAEIMNDYQAYLAEIETEFPTEEEETGNNPQLKSVNATKDLIRKASRDKDVESAPDKLQRSWYYGKKSSYDGDDEPIYRKKSSYGGDDPIFNRPVFDDDVTALTDDFESGMLRRGQKYTHPWLHSRRVRKGVVTVAALAVVIGLSVGMTKGKNEGDESKLDELEKNMADAGKPQGLSPEDQAKYAEEEAYKMMATKYRPMIYSRKEGWMGHTYEEALAFCGHRAGYTVCPYEAICPGGPDDQPLGGYKEASEGPNSWVPMLEENDWVQVGHADSCIAYSHMHDTLPDWGVSGKDNDALTENVMCCLGTDLVNKVSYEETSKLYQPREFDRSSGWNGKTYHEAVTFCQGIEGYNLCAYEAVCPMGPDAEPLGGIKDPAPKMNKAWMPLLNSMNEWVQIGGDDACIAYSHIHPDRPEWGMTGEGSELLTENLMCCLNQSKTSGQVEALSYQMVVEKYQPHLYNRKSGWKGTDYEAAMDFCAQAEDGYDLCTYDAICPMGPDSEPVSAYADEPVAWVPILDEGNAYVQIGKDNACIRYTEMNPDSPQWGFNGIGDEEITQNVLCCARGFGMGVESEHAVEAPKAKPFSKPAKPGAKPEGMPAGLVGHTDDDLNLYMEIATAFEPKWYNREKGWKGQTFKEAQAFCSAVKNPDKPDRKYGICPLPAICPLGADTEPLGGFRETDGGKGVSWVPIETPQNEWVQASSKNTCILFSSMNKDVTPEWSVTGKGNEALTRHLACCLIQEDEAPANIPVIAKTPTTGAGALPPPMQTQPEYIEMAEKYRPVWHSREKGWQGRTYLEALQYCEASSPDGDYEVCPMEAICPLGAKSEPLGGFRTDGGDGAWVPVLDDPNQWLQVSKNGFGGVCIPYTNMHPSMPEWGLTGDGSEEITRHVVCCKSQVDKKKPSAPLSAVEVAKPSDTSPMTADVPDATDKQVSLAYQTVSQKYKPKWFDRTKGWKGTTYLEAAMFCEDFNNYLPCPYEAICPLGKGTKPLSGFKDDDTSEGGVWAPILEGPNDWVQISSDGANSCHRWSHLHPGPPAWGETGEGSEELTRHVACCFDVSSTEEPTPPPTPPLTPKPTKIEQEPTPSPTYDAKYYYQVIAETLKPQWYGRGEGGWDGTTYLDGLQFCAKQESRVPCPYVAYCPLAHEADPFGGVKEGVSWAPIFDSPNSWVQVGAEETCKRYSDLFRTPPQWGLTGEDAEDLTGHIMCCLETPETEAPPEKKPAGELVLTETEQTVMDVFKAEWFTRDDGYMGGTYEESEEYCSNIAGHELCPLLAYCPNGPSTEADGKPLFLQLDPFKGEAWAPIKKELDSDDDIYVLIGTLNGNPTTSCHTYRHFHDGEMPEWGLDGSHPEVKPAVLCCKNPEYISTGLSSPSVDLTLGSPEIPAAKLADAGFNAETEISKSLGPVWLDASDGWAGGSHDDAEAFCAKKGGRQICPYAAYCPHGPGQPVSKGHTMDISAEGVQWSPVFGHDNHWVMVGQKNGNSATTCFSHEDLEGGAPDWGLTKGKVEIKMHVACCAP